MFNRIRNYFEDRLVTKSAAKTFKLLQAKVQQDTEFHVYKKTSSENALTFTGNDGEEIFSISFDGEAIWHKEDAYSEAAEMFLTHLTMHIEDNAGIMQNRIEWEERITEALAREAEAAPLGPKELTDIVRKCIMIDKLKGIKN